MPYFAMLKNPLKIQDLLWPNPHYISDDLLTFYGMGHL